MMDGSRNSPRLVLVVALGFASVLAALAIAAYLRSYEDDGTSGFRVPDEEMHSTDTAPLLRYTTVLARQLARLSPFDTEVGGVMGGIVPIVDVAGAERTKLRGLWERIVAPDFNPEENTGIEWRKLRWSEVRWQARDGRHKNPSPPRIEGYAARWFIDESPFVVDGWWRPNNLGWVRITISLAGNDQLRCKYPRLEDLAPQGPFRIVVNEIDKTRLLAILTTVFRFPWETVDDFVVTWSPSPTSAGHLRIESSRPRQRGDSVDWFDEVPLHIESVDPQKVSITVVFHARVPHPCEARVGDG